MNQTDAARGAGYAHNSEMSLRATGYRLARDPEIQQAAHHERESILSGSLASKAIKTLGNILDDETAPAPAKVAAAKWILEAAGHGIENRRITSKAAETMNQGLADMTTEELIVFIRRGNAKMRDVTPPAIDIEADVEKEGQGLTREWSEKKKQNPSKSLGDQ